MAQDPHEDVKQSRAALTAAALAVVYAEMRTDVLKRLNATGDTIALLRDIWQAAVGSVVSSEIKVTASAIGQDATGSFRLEYAENYLDAVADNFAEHWHKDLAEQMAETSAQIDATFAAMQEEIEKLTAATVARAEDDARNLTDLSANFATVEDARASDSTTKTWHLGTGGNHRPSHVALDGVTIGIEERFANGLRYPHAPGPPAETINCNCWLSFGR